MSDAVLNHLTFLRKTVEGLPHGKDVVSRVESKTGVAIEHLLGGVEGLLVLCIFCGIGASFITNLIGFIYPSVATLLALESTDKKDDNHWLVYWVVFSTFCLVDPVVEWFLIYWIPFFYPVKAAFLLWMMLPQYNGAQVIYKKMKEKMFLSGGSDEDKTK